VLAATNPVISSAADAIKIFMLFSISTPQLSQSDSLGALTERRLSKIAHFGLKRAGPVWVIRVQLVGGGHGRARSPGRLHDPAGRIDTHITEALLKNRPLYDPLRDLEPISNIAISPFGLAVNPSVPARTLQELVAMPRPIPASCPTGTPG
jgi:hypothetical protein